MLNARYKTCRGAECCKNATLDKNVLRQASLVFAI